MVSAHESDRSSQALRGHADTWESIPGAVMGQWEGPRDPGPPRSSPSAFLCLLD